MSKKTNNESCKKFIDIKVFDKTNKYLKFFSPFAPILAERAMPFESIYSSQKYNHFFNIKDIVPNNMINYYRITDIIQKLVNEFYFAYEKRNYTKNYGCAENLFNFIISCVYNNLKPKTKNIPLHNYFDYERQYIDYWYISDLVFHAKNNFLLKRNNPEFLKYQKWLSSANSKTPEQLAEYLDVLYKTHKKHNFGIYSNQERFGLIEDNLVYCCLGFVLVDKFLENEYDNVNILFDLFNINETLTDGIDKNLLQKEVESRISEQNSKKCQKAGKASGVSRREAKNKGYELWKKENLSKYNTEAALSYYNNLIKEYNLGEDTIKKSWFPDYRKWDNDQSNIVR